MSFRTVILLVHCLLATSVAMKCQKISGSLKQIDAGVGQVYGVDDKDKVLIRHKNEWVSVHGSLKHVTVGPSGVWGVDSSDQIYKLVDQEWVHVEGVLRQVDAGGTWFIAGADKEGAITCKGWEPGHSDTALKSSWTHIPGPIKYTSCGPDGCWDVNNNGDIYFRKVVTATKCTGTGDWNRIGGLKMKMVEVGTDGSVFAVDADGHGGHVHRRTGISAKRPAGTRWTRESVPGMIKIKHVSYDKGQLWVITSENNILRCSPQK